MEKGITEGFQRYFGGMTDPRLDTLRAKPLNL